MPVIYATHPLHPVAESRLAGLATLSIASAFDQATLVREATGADVVIARAPLPAALFDRARNLRGAIRQGSGPDLVPVDVATSHGVLVSHVPGALARSVAEYVFSAALALLRPVSRIDADLRRNGWFAARNGASQMAELFGKTIGIVGFGAVGRAVQAIASGFGMRVLIHTRSKKPFPKGTESRTLVTLFAEADMVVVCCPSTEETRSLINAEMLGRLRPHALFVNLSRGMVVEEAALIAALRNRQIAGAILDAFETQPLAQANPLFAFENVILTPFIAGSTVESMERMSIGAVDEALLILGGGLPANLLNPEAVDEYRRRFG